MTHSAENASITTLPTDGPTTVKQDLMAAALAGLIPLGGGLLILIGYLWVSWFGVILGFLGVGGWLFWWREEHGAIFPTTLKPKSLVGVIALVAVLGVIFALI